MRLIKNRSKFLLISKTRNKKGRLGLYCTISFLFLVTAGYLRETIIKGELSPLQIAIAPLMLIIVISMINIHKSIKDKIKNPLVYNPEKKGDKRVINLFVAGTTSIIFGLVGLVLFMVTIFSLIPEVKNIYVIYEQARKIGTSKIEILNKDEVFLGNTLKIKFENPLLYQNLPRVEVFLRNVHEKWDEIGDHWSYTYFLHEERQVHQINNNTLTFDFTIPLTGVKGTDYVKHAPYYWELEVSNEEHQFFTRFFIEVHQLELVDSQQD